MTKIALLFAAAACVVACGGPEFASADALTTSDPPALDADPPPADGAPAVDGPSKGPGGGEPTSEGGVDGGSEPEASTDASDAGAMETSAPDAVSMDAADAGPVMDASIDVGHIVDATPDVPIEACVPPPPSVTYQCGSNWGSVQSPGQYPLCIQSDSYAQGATTPPPCQACGSYTCACLAAHGQSCGSAGTWTCTDRSGVPYVVCE